MLVYHDYSKGHRTEYFFKIQFLAVALYAKLFALKKLSKPATLMKARQEVMKLIAVELKSRIGLKVTPMNFFTSSGERIFEFNQLLNLKAMQAEEAQG